MEDKKIIDLYFNRSEQAITATSEKYGKMCRTIASRLLKNDEDAEECVNDTYLTLWNTIPPENPNPFMAYICKIVRNITLKKYRYNTAEKRNTFYDVSMDELEECLESINNIENEMNAKELSEIINEFLGRLKEKDRVIFVKRYWFCMDIAELADEMGLTKNYVNVHLHRVKEKLREYLIKEHLYEERIG